MRRDAARAGGARADTPRYGAARTGVTAGLAAACTGNPLAWEEAGGAMAGDDPWGRFHGPNAGYALELYERYRQDPGAVDAATRAFFEGANGGANGAGMVPVAAAPDSFSVPGARSFSAETEIARAVAAARLARGIREYGHLAADIDPLGATRPGDPMLDPATHGLTDDDLAALPASIVWRAVGADAGSCRDAIGRLRAIYSGTTGYDFDHVQDFGERAWLTERVEAGGLRAPLAPGARRALLERLTEVERFERFLHATFQGQTRFSIEGCDALVPMLDALIRLAAGAGTREILIGMAHRGRLNVLAHTLGKPYGAIFSEFHHAPHKEMVPSEGSHGVTAGWTGDVKYHLGARRTVREGDSVGVQLTLAHNPSHLEFIDPVVSGAARAAQEDRGAAGFPRQHPDRALAVTIHGDAAFPGEGVVAETLNLSRLPGYQTGGTIRIIVNNQVGFTTGVDDGRSTLYASDPAKGFEIPIVHVNADDPEACLAALGLAHAYRQRFRKDFLVDLVGYRRWGHNEGDEPAFTQPQLYARIAAHPTVRALYAQRLASDGLVGAEEAESLVARVQERLRAAQAAAATHPPGDDELQPRDAPPLASYHTAVPADTLRAINEGLLARPSGFAPHGRLDRILARRREGLDRPGGIDWGHAEALAFGAILADAVPIRLTGQDSERGTFNQRHLILADVETGAKFSPLGALPGARAAFAVHNSPLSEAAPLGFEYGYSVHAPETLVLWEAQFGDFVNAGQVAIDQFIASARAKWRREPSLVLLLPHGHEGQGPEHSSARPERFLQLATEDNLRIAYPTTAAQYFHLLRAQAATLRDARRPLIVMTPKSLLRHPRAGSGLADLAEGGWRPVLDDPMAAERRAAVERLLLCSGKVAVDLATTEREGIDWVAIARLEQLYPFPAEAVARLLDGYPRLGEVVWVQEEPRNMGAWTYAALWLAKTLAARGLPLRYIGRPEHAATAEGDAVAHAAAQARIVEAALGGERPAKIETLGGQEAG
jgi:2-oxoglutarate dehydrogenase E1 component